MATATAMQPFDTRQIVTRGCRDAFEIFLGFLGIIQANKLRISHVDIHPRCPRTPSPNAPMVLRPGEFLLSKSCSSQLSSSLLMHATRACCLSLVWTSIAASHGGRVPGQGEDTARTVHRTAAALSVFCPKPRRPPHHRVQKPLAPAPTALRLARGGPSDWSPS